MHGRTHRPAGLPKGVAGTYDRNPGTNGDDIAPPMPVHDDPDILRRELASIPQRDGPEYDGLRTRLARAELGQMESKEKHATAADMFRSLSETGGGTWSPRNDATPVVGFCHSPYPERSRVVAMPSTTDDFARLSMEYLMDNRDLLSKTATIWDYGATRPTTDYMSTSPSATWTRMTSGTHVPNMIR